MLGDCGDGALSVLLQVADQHLTARIGRLFSEQAADAVGRPVGQNEDAVDETDAHAGARGHACGACIASNCFKLMSAGSVGMDASG